MSFERLWVAYAVMTRKEIVRFMRIWSQSLLPSVVTTTLYYVIFGTFIGSQIAPVGEYSYIQFIVPGLVMMAVITNSYANVVSSFFGAKFQRQLEELLVSPVTPFVIIAAFVTGGMLRGILVGVLVLGLSLFFTQLAIANMGVIFIFIVLTAILFSLAGLINGIFAKSFDGISIVPTFVLTPLTYLGGIFYSISVLPAFWQQVSLFNPILYLVNGFRYGFLGISDVSVALSLGILIFLIVLCYAVALFLFRTGRGLRS